MSAAHFLAVDLGAESGRCMLASYDGAQLSLREVHRFPNIPVEAQGQLRWDVLRLFHEVKQGMAKAAAACGSELRSLGVDTWGVDFALLDAHGDLLGNPYHYRDGLVEGMMGEAFRLVPREEIYAGTGNLFSPINSLYRLLALARQKPAHLEAARMLLMIPDLFNYWLTGQAVCEYTEASTSQLLDANTGDWNRSLLERLGIRTDILAPIVQPGTRLGELLAPVADETGLPALPVIAPASHDNASAVATVCADCDFHITSGTWCTVGIELPRPLISQRSMDANFTNEGGAGGTITFFRLISGLWLIQECRRAWQAAGQAFSYDDICAMAAASEPFLAIIDVDAPELLPAGHMPERIQDYCRRSGQPVPATPGAISRAIFESLALKYRYATDKLEEVSGKRLGHVQVIGGGSLNCLLNQFVADALDRPVTAGPAEATAVGNALLQMLALGYVSSLAEGRQLIKESFCGDTYLPAGHLSWRAAYDRLLALVEPTGQ